MKAVEVEGDLAYEGLAELTVGDLNPVTLWARIHVREPGDLVEVAASAPPTRIDADRPRWLVHLGPERPDLPHDEQPPTWPPPFPIPAGLEPQPLCRVTVRTADRAEHIDGLHLEFEVKIPMMKSQSWEAVLT